MLLTHFLHRPRHFRNHSSTAITTEHAIVIRGDVAWHRSVWAAIREQKLPDQAQPMPAHVEAAPPEPSRPVAYWQKGGQLHRVEVIEANDQTACIWPVETSHLITVPADQVVFEAAS